MNIHEMEAGPELGAHEGGHKGGQMPNSCPYDPQELAGLPIGMTHCPLCGEMVLAGFPHPDYSEEGEAETDAAYLRWVEEDMRQRGITDDAQ